MAQDTASLSATTLPIVKGVRHVAMAVLNAFDAASVSAGVELIHDAISRLRWVAVGSWFEPTHTHTSHAIT